AIVTGAPDRRAPRLVRRGRVARGAGIGATALAAVSVTALVVGNPFAAPAPLFAAAGGGGGRTAAGLLAADARMTLWVDYDYEAGAGLSHDGGRGNVYELRRSGEPREVAHDAAAALGLAGTASASTYSTPEYPSFVVGPEDGSAPSLSLSWTGSGDWWYNDPTAYPAPVCQDVAFTNDDGTDGSYPDCSVPEAPAAEAKAPSDPRRRGLSR